MNLEKQRKINLRKDVNDYQSKRINKKQTYSQTNSPKSELVKMFKRLPSRKILEGIYYSTMQLFKI